MKPPKVRGSADQFIAQDKKHKKDGIITINALPDEILVRIVSFLPLKDAAATSILSRLWRYVWTFTTNLDFYGDRALQSMIFDEDTYFEILDSERAKYINWVNRVINLHRGGHIDRFRIHFDLDHTFTSSIDTWINFAKQKRVQILELELQLMDNSPFYTILGEHIVGFEYSLKVLRLVYVELTGEVIQCLLSKCKLLEQLEVQCSFKLDKLRVAGPSLALKHLCLYGCHKVERIEICDALELVSFYLTCDKWQPLRLITRNVPKLVDIYIRLQGKPVRHVFTMLTSCSYPLSQLQILQLNIALEKYVAKRVYPTLTNLKQLNLLLNRCDKYNLLKLIPFMKSFPYLTKLVLKFLPWVDDDDDGVQELVKATKCPHHSLKEVEILGYSGRRSDVELIIYLIENAVSLEKIIVNPYRFEEFLWTKPHSSLKSEKEEEMAKHHALQHLKEKIPSTMEFICL